MSWPIFSESLKHTTASIFLEVTHKHMSEDTQPHMEALRQTETSPG